MFYLFLLDYISIGKSEILKVPNITELTLIWGFLLTCIYSTRHTYIHCIYTFNCNNLQLDYWHSKYEVAFIIFYDQLLLKIHLVRYENSYNCLFPYCFLTIVFFHLALRYCLSLMVRYVSWRQQEDWFYFSSSIS